MRWCATLGAKLAMQSMCQREMLKPMSAQACLHTSREHDQRLARCLHHPRHWQVHHHGDAPSARSSFSDGDILLIVC